MDKVFIKNLSVNAIIGIYEDERNIPQDILINVIMQTEERQANTNDSIEYCVNYHKMALRIREHTETKQRFTVEALAEDIAEICLMDEMVKTVTVKVEKPDAISFTDSVGVEIERSK